MTKQEVWKAPTATTTAEYLIPWDTVITDIDGTELKDSIAQQNNPTKEAPALTLGLTCRHSLTMIDVRDDKITSAKKFEYGSLALDIYKGEVKTLPAEKISELKELIGKLYGPVVVLRAHLLLDPSTKRK